ncbi:hypothetical protein M422DRAFT_150605, partial [Sphaerobolus stellatus SS14]
MIIGALRSTVANRISIGHLCCAVHDRKISLESQNDHYCPLHSATENECVVVGCSSIIETGWKTCAISQHQHLEDYAHLQGMAMFQSKQRLQMV